MSGRGFTLLEVTAVLLIMAIVAGVAVLNLSGPVAQARLDDCLAEIAAFDDLVRGYSLAHHKVSVLQIDLENNTLIRGHTEDETLKVSRSLPGRFQIRAVYTSEERFEDTRVPIVYSAMGLSRSYAVGVEDGHGQRQWLFVAGLTGETHLYEREEDVESFFAAWRGRPDTD